MSAAAILPAAFGLVGAGASMLMNKPKAPSPVLQPTKDEAADRANQRDQLSRRRGSGANELLGPLGAEASAGGKTSLGT